MTRDQLKQLEADLWSAADNLRANSDLKSSEYATPVFGLIFLKFADNNYRHHCRVSKAQRHTAREKNVRHRHRAMRILSARSCPLRLPAEAAGGKRHRQGAQGGHEGRRGIQWMTTIIPFHQRQLNLQAEAIP